MLGLLFQGYKVDRETIKIVIVAAVVRLQNRQKGYNACMCCLWQGRQILERLSSLMVLQLQGRQIDKRKEHPGAAVATLQESQIDSKTGVKSLLRAGKTPEELADFVNEQEMKKFLVSCASGVVPDQAPASQVSTHFHNLLASVAQGWCPTRHLQNWSVLTVTSS
jgi:hypothetical protein